MSAHVPAPTSGDLGTPAVHVCTTQYRGRDALHVVLPPRLPAGTPLADLQDAGHEVLAVGVFPGELPECPHADAYPGCEHVVLRSSGSVR